MGEHVAAVLVRILFEEPAPIARRRPGLPVAVADLLDDMLKIISLDRKKNIYIANMVKCRPPKNRDPLNTEQDACIDYLRGQFKLLKPKIVVCLGRISAGRLIGEDFKISKDHGKWYDKDGVRFMALYHPAALLRDPRRRPETFVDLKELERVIKESAPGTYVMS